MALIKIPKEMGSTPGIVDNSNATAITIDSSENATFAGAVTINNNSPLKLNGTDPLISFQNGAANHWQVGFENTNSDRFVFYDNNASAYRLVIDSSGNVGIGTSTPQGNLSVTGSSAAVGDQGIFQVTDGTGANTDTKIVMGVVASDYGWIQAVKPGTNVFDLALQPNGGNVGIGTATPDAKLSVDVGTAADGIKFGVYYSPVNSLPRGTITWDDGAAITGQIDTRYDGTTVDMHIGSLYSSGYNTSTKMIIKGNGNVEIPDGNLVVAAGHGIDFSANANAGGMTSELLDDYEEGVFTMSLNGCTSYNQTGQYTKVGDLVYFSFYSGGIATSNGSQASFSGLPFAAVNNGALYTIFWTAHNTLTSNAFTGYLTVNTTSGFFTTNNSAAVPNYVNGSNKYVMISGVYKTSA